MKLHIVLLVLLFPLHVHAQEFETEIAISARKQYLEALEKATSDHQNRLLEIKKDYSSQLASARKEALESGNLDEAQKILAVETETKSDTYAPRFPNSELRSLTSRVSNTKWHAIENPNRQWFFLQDGTLAGTDITWAAIDRQRIALCFANGAIDIIKFADSFREFDYILGPRPDEEPDRRNHGKFRERVKE